MKRLFALSILALTIAAGCHGQQPVTPPQQTCPPLGTYTPLNGTTGSASTSYTDTPSGARCYLAQGYLPAANGVPAQTGPASNIVGPSTGGATGKVGLSVNCTATSGTTCAVNWIFSSAAAIVATAPATPSMGNPTQSMVVKPAMPEVAANIASPVLTLGK